MAMMASFPTRPRGSADTTPLEKVRASDRELRVEMPAEDLVVDTTGKFCPVPVIEIAKAMKRVERGQVVLLVATDPGVVTDLPAWCKATRHEYLGLFREGKVLRVFVRRSR
jgi:TusA-related sulfurtransferase